MEELRQKLRMKELQKALNERSLTVSNLLDKGRCLFTTRDFSPGEVIISQDPYVAVPNNNSTDSSSKCEWCFRSGNLKKCSACHVVWYCGSTCQKMDWKLHHLECQVLRKVDKGRIKSLTPSIRLMVKLYVRRKLQREQVITTTSTDNYDLVEALVSHMSDIDEKQLVLYAQMANLVYLVLQWPEVEINIKDIAANFSKLACNAHTICDDELRPLATGLYPVISLINHSCLPNSVLVFEGKLAVVRAVQHIPKGSEIFMELQNWKEALAYCRLVIPVYERVYQRFHPLVGLQYYTCGKLEWFLGETNAFRSLTKAFDILRITHGTSTPFMKELLIKLEEARAEAMYNLSS